MRQPILYDLNRSWPIGEQPYVYMKSLWLNFEWGITLKYWLYLGIIAGIHEDVATFLASQEFKCVAQTKESAIEFFADTVSEFTDEQWTHTVADQVAAFALKLEW